MKPYPNEELDRMSKREIIRLYKRTVEQFSDAVPVIRCKDCVNCRESTLAGRTWKHCAFIGNVVYDDNYCCWAERKE